MKRLFLLLFVSILAPAIAFEQSEKEPVPEYLKNKNIPAFSLFSSPDSILYTKENLPKGVPIVIVYFSPDCGHCQYEAIEIVKNMKKLDKAFFLWVSYRKISEIAEFAKKYELEKYQNVKFVRDTKYVLPPYYKVEFTPFIVIYNSKGYYKKEYRTGAKVEELIEAVN